MESQSIEESGALIEEGHRWLREFNSGEEGRRNSCKASGADLARRMDSAAMDLSYNRATEFHDYIKTLIMLAAKVAVLTWGVASPEIAAYEQSVYYYRAFPAARAFVDEYDTFKRSCT